MDPSERTANVQTLDDPAAMGPDELMELYRTARTPTLEELDGKLTGRMLSVPRAQEPHVKAFKHETANHGHGVNGLLAERVAWLSCHTFVGPSHAGNFDAVHLDYGHDRNPPVARNVKDEVREVAPGFYLGLVYLSMRDSEHLGCFFGIREGES